MAQMLDVPIVLPVIIEAEVLEPANSAHLDDTHSQVHRRALIAVQESSCAHMVPALALLVR